MPTIYVYFSNEEFEKIARAAIKDNKQITDWIKDVVKEKLKEVSGDERGEA